MLVDAIFKGARGDSISFKFATELNTDTTIKISLCYYSIV